MRREAQVDYGGRSKSGGDTVDKEHSGTKAQV